jgi:hypothetical protein
MTDKPIPKPDEAWIDQGVLYAQYNGSIETTTIIALMEQCTALIAKEGKMVMPIVVIFAPGSHMTLSMSHLSKVINTSFLKRISVIFLVGAEHGQTHMLSIISKVFLKGHLYPVKSIEEAGQKARAYVHEDRAILEWE